MDYHTSLESQNSTDYEYRQFKLIPSLISKSLRILRTPYTTPVMDHHYSSNGSPGFILKIIDQLSYFFHQSVSKLGNNIHVKI